MKFFFPDSQDLVDPSFDFDSEDRAEARVRQRDDLYAHEVFAEAPYDGLLVSRAIVDGQGGLSSGRYSLGQRQRFYRRGAREFLRIEGRPLEVMGDCGAFAYVRESVPPVTVDDTIQFYDECQFDYGVSVDHVILAYDEKADRPLPGIDPVREEWRKRQEITLDLAREFLKRHKAGRYSFAAVGVAQGWSPKSYAAAVKALQKMGYGYVALGGMVPLKSHEILACLSAIDAVRKPETRLHLFGVSRCEHVPTFATHGVTSFDSTSPLRQAFKEDYDNYHPAEKNYPAIRVPQVDGNAKLKRRIVAGEVDQREALRLERECLDHLKRYDLKGGQTDKLVKVLHEYGELCGNPRDYRTYYRDLLEARPWKKCPCEVCQAIGIHVVIFRGAERNRRRGFHNVYVTWRHLKNQWERIERCLN